MKKEAKLSIPSSLIKAVKMDKCKRNVVLICILIIDARKVMQREEMYAMQGKRISGLGNEKPSEERKLGNLGEGAESD